MPSVDINVVVENMSPPEQPYLTDCPFCGNGKLYWIQHPNDPEEMEPIMCFYVCCDECGVEGPSAKSPEEAVRKWNIRV